MPRAMSRAIQPADARSPAVSTLQPPCGSVRECPHYRGELARHRVITADGHHVVVATVSPTGARGHFTTAVYPVQYGYLVLVRQPLHQERATSADCAQQQHDQLVRVLAEAGLAVVRARHTLAARRRAEFRSTPSLPRERHAFRGNLPTPAGV